MPGRISNEIKQIQNDSDGISKSTGGKVHIIFPENLEEEINDFQGVFEGPPDTPFSEGIFTVSFQLPADYPMKPPVVEFETRIWHPNVDFETGLVSLNILSKEWSPAWTLQSVLLAIWSLLSNPLLDLPINFEAASQYRSNRREFGDQARFADMGFPVEIARPILEQVQWDEEVAVELLLQQQKLL